MALLKMFIFSKNRNCYVPDVGMIETYQIFKLVLKSLIIKHPPNDTCMMWEVALKVKITVYIHPYYSIMLKKMKKKHICTASILILRELDFNDDNNGNRLS